MKTPETPIHQVEMQGHYKKLAEMFQRFERVTVREGGQEFEAEIDDIMISELSDKITFILRVKNGPHTESITRSLELVHLSPGIGNVSSEGIRVRNPGLEHNLLEILKHDVPPQIRTDETIDDIVEQTNRPI